MFNQNINSNAINENNQKHVYISFTYVGYFNQINNLIISNTILKVTFNSNNTNFNRLIPTPNFQKVM